uniref:Uncharacterized protein n=1 Tax=Tetraselmis sp. GSL018 TaxID=582737 RepID=A0A061QT06_9CHLO|mmetsp:Transcript_23854/g.56835  ORF Transcript_23854/g.56835 Transcript_23854/m.56835 type:complete len:211 (+) Transcript_23854:142-774(+)|eukprot:CAMPEP_0177618790 /NCGR_PEP_ID=MMETSP0419_2-20121207/25822_1 /TAXON_ID=582737 /ORGANISM="Tetraselmis sp., Strain GSL018" /LENGTH=210 /DNA_ID=CAMNT_0019117829 /DNA_START=83 /DNA_END=715 /DNA_ORIENTATION=+
MGQEVLADKENLDPRKRRSISKSLKKLFSSKSNASGTTYETANSEEENAFGPENVKPAEKLVEVKVNELTPTRENEKTVPVDSTSPTTSAAEETIRMYGTPTYAAVVTPNIINEDDVEEVDHSRSDSEVLYEGSVDTKEYVFEDGTQKEQEGTDGNKPESVAESTTSEQPEPIGEEDFRSERKPSPRAGNVLGWLFPILNCGILKNCQPV